MYMHADSIKLTADGKRLQIFHT